MSPLSFSSFFSIRPVNIRQPFQPLYLYPRMQSACNPLIPGRFYRLSATTSKAEQKCCEERIKAAVDKAVEETKAEAVEHVTRKLLQNGFTLGKIMDILGLDFVKAGQAKYEKLKAPDDSSS